AALEYATDVKSVVVGKPDRGFFNLALRDMDIPPTEAVMIGDDVRDDVGGAMALGMKGVLVKTGKYRPLDESKHGVTPTRVVSDFSEAVDLILSNSDFFSFPEREQEPPSPTAPENYFTQDVFFLELVTATQMGRSISSQSTLHDTSDLSTIRQSKASNLATRLKNFPSPSSSNHIEDLLILLDELKSLHMSSHSLLKHHPDLFEDTICRKRIQALESWGWVMEWLRIETIVAFQWLRLYRYPEGKFFRLPNAYDRCLETLRNGLMKVKSTFHEFKEEFIVMGIPLFPSLLQALCLFPVTFIQLVFKRHKDSYVQSLEAGERIDRESVVHNILMLRCSRVILLKSDTIADPMLGWTLWSEGQVLEKYAQSASASVSLHQQTRFFKLENILLRLPKMLGYLTETAPPHIDLSCLYLVNESLFRSMVALIRTRQEQFEGTYSQDRPRRHSSARISPTHTDCVHKLTASIATFGLSLRSWIDRTGYNISIDSNRPQETLTSMMDIPGHGSYDVDGILASTRPRLRMTRLLSVLCMDWLEALERDRNVRSHLSLVKSAAPEVSSSRQELHSSFEQSVEVPPKYAYEIQVLRILSDLGELQLTDMEFAILRGCVARFLAFCSAEASRHGFEGAVRESEGGGGDRGDGSSAGRRVLSVGRERSAGAGQSGGGTSASGNVPGSVSGTSLQFEPSEEVIESKGGQRRYRLLSEALGPNFRWQQGRLLGAGSDGSVHMAINCSTGELLAVKEIRLREFEVERNDAFKFVKQMMDILQQLEHVNTVQYYGFEVMPEKLLVFMEYCPDSLEKILRRRGKLEETLIQYYVKQILQGLHYIHGMSILHRDIKPGNILIGSDGRVKLADFGSSRQITSSMRARFGSTGTRLVRSLAGTPHYIAPEVINGGAPGPIGAQDIWSLGCCIIEMATGVTPWATGVPETESEWAVVYRIGLKASPPPLPSPSELSQAGRDFLLRTFKPAPERPTASALLTDDWIRTVPL
ncbi:Suppressor of Sensor Kinase (SLN1), partial [Blyttiomyces sp. JEL0837]